MKHDVAPGIFYTMFVVNVFVALVKWIVFDVLHVDDLKHRLMDAKRKSDWAKHAGPGWSK